MGRRGVVTAGHYLASSAGLRIMTAGGNAIDAAAAMSICLTLLEPHLCGIGGEVPTLIYSARERKTYAISGMGWSPAAFTIDWCRDHGIDLIPGDGYLPACVPAVVGTWTTALARFGTMSFAEILQPAIELAEQGFPVYEALSRHLHQERATYTERYPTTGAVYLAGGGAPAVGEPLRNPDFGAMLRIMCRAEEGARGRGRVAGIEAACDAFYRGEIAERIVRFIGDHPVEDASGGAHTGLLSCEDFADWRAGVEEPVTLNYRGLDVYKCPSWTQGPVFLQQLAILQHLDVAARGHNSPDYLHTWIECAKLAFADREAYYGDPGFDAVPFDVLLSADYGERAPPRSGTPPHWICIRATWAAASLSTRCAAYWTTIGVPWDWRRGIGARPKTAVPVPVAGPCRRMQRIAATPPISTRWTPRATWWRLPRAAAGSVRRR